MGQFNAQAIIAWGFVEGATLVLAWAYNAWASTAWAFAGGSKAWAFTAWAFARVACSIPIGRHASEEAGAFATAWAFATAGQSGVPTCGVEGRPTPHPASAFMKAWAHAALVDEAASSIRRMGEFNAQDRRVQCGVEGQPTPRLEWALATEAQKS